MIKYEYMNRYCELIEKANEKEAKLEAYVQNWLLNKETLSLEKLEATITTVNDQIAQIRSAAENIRLEFERLSKEEKLENENLESSKTTEMRLKFQLGHDANKMSITGGVLSSSGPVSKSHLACKYKSKEDLEIDKQLALALLREKVIKKEIPLEKALLLKDDIEKENGKNNEVSSSKKI